MAGTTTALQPTVERPRVARGPLASLRGEVEDILATFIDASDGWLAGRIVPPLDLSETGDAVEVKMDVPGIMSADIDVRINGNLLTISGQRKEEKEEKGRTYHRIERRSGGFSRSITLPCAVDESKIDAQYRDGILRVILPKTEESKAHKITVKG